MAKTAPGNVYEVRVQDRFAYIQHIKNVPDMGILARVFTTLHASRPSLLAPMVSGPSYRVFYPIDAALRKPALILYVGKEGLSDVDAAPLQFRTGNTVYVEGVGERMVRSSQLSEEERKYPTFKMSSHHFILKDILAANGVIVTAAEMTIKDVEQIPADHSLFFLYFPRKIDASRAADFVAMHSRLNKFEYLIEKDDDKSWLLRLNGKLAASGGELDQMLREVATRFGGTYDGFEHPVS